MEGVAFKPFVVVVVVFVYLFSCFLYKQEDLTVSKCAAKAVGKISFGALLPTAKRQEKK